MLSNDAGTTGTFLPINQATSQQTSLPIDQSTSHLITYVLHLADNSLILGHRNSEWTGHGPILEQDIALSNIALDLIGQSRNLYQYAAKLISENEALRQAFRNGEGEVTEDDLAYLRDVREFRNCLLVEQPNGDWGQTILRQFLFSAYQFAFYNRLRNSTNEQLAAIAEKSVKETTYHLRWSSEWVIRLGDGTSESHDRMLKALDELWMFTGELFAPAMYEQQLTNEGLAVDLTLIKPEWIERVKAVFNEATLPLPEEDGKQTGGKEGMHSEHLGYILAEMQFLQRSHPNASW